MTRHTFGQTLTDWTMDLASTTTSGGVTTAPVIATGPATITFWSAPTGGSQYTDLLNGVGTPVTTISSSDGSDGLPVGTIPQFSGPDNVTEMWADAGAGARFKMVATDLGSIVGDLVFTNDFLSALETLAVSGGAVGQFLGKDPDPESATGVRWTAPPESGGGASGTMWVDASAGAYAADKTGVLDARAPIQAAIDDVSAAGGGIVYLPRGTYKIGYTSNAGSTGAAGGLQLKDKVWLRGDGISTRLEASGTWSSDAGIIGIGDAATTRAVRDTRVSDMWIKGSAGTSHVEPVQYIHGLLYNTASITVEPDACHRIHDLTIWDCDRGLALFGDDDQAMFVQRIRGRWFRQQAILDGRTDLSGGGPDNYFLNIDVSSANRLASGTCAGIEIYASNTHWISCKSWFNKRATAFVEGATYKDGAGWYVGNIRNVLIACEAQDNGGHGVVDRFGKTTYSGCVADSNNNNQCISGSALANECSGFYFGSGVGEVTAVGLLSFDRNSTASLRYQRYGYVIDAAARNVELKGIAWDNRSTGSAADPLDGVKWVNGAAHSSHEVRVLAAYGTTRTTISNGGTTGSGAGAVQKRQDSGGGSTVYTGTTLQDVPVLVAQIPGGSRYYRIEAQLYYRADATNNARIGIRTARDGASGSVDVEWFAAFVKPDGTSGNEYSRSQVGTTRFIIADGDGGVASSGYTNQRGCHIVGHVFVGSTVVTGTVAIQVCENGGSGTGVKVVENSNLVITPANYS